MDQHADRLGAERRHVHGAGRIALRAVAEHDRAGRDRKARVGGEARATDEQHLEGVAHRRIVRVHRVHPYTETGSAEKLEVGRPKRIGTQSSGSSWTTSMPRASSAFCFNGTPTTEIYTLSLHAALPI